MLEHGGGLHAAARAYGISPVDWLDLSTGINPHAWPGATERPIPADAWRRLPEAVDGLVAAAQACYGAPSAACVLPVAGSQAAIQSLPFLRPPCRVAIRTPCYAEHARAWRRAGHELVAWHEHDLDLADTADVLVLANPNNPDGRRHDPVRLLAWHERLAARGGWLVVDEAFIDATPWDSLAAHCARPGLIVLRSLGKFFGLAGARVGFALAEPALLNELEEALGPWPLAGPSRWLARHALQDGAWQAATRARLDVASQRLAGLLAAHGLPPSGGCALFQWVLTQHAAQLQHRLAQRAILVRRFAAHAGAGGLSEAPGLRFGLPAGEADWARLNETLAASLPGNDRIADNVPETAVSSLSPNPSPASGRGEHRVLRCCDYWIGPCIR